MSEQTPGSAAVPSEPRRWTIYVCPVCGRAKLDTVWPVPERGWCDGACTHPVVTLVPVTVEEVGPVSEAQVEAGARAVLDAMQSTFGYREWGDFPDDSPIGRELRDVARAVLSAAREVKSDGTQTKPTTMTDAEMLADFIGRTLSRKLDTAQQAHALRLLESVAARAEAAERERDALAGILNSAASEIINGADRAKVANDMLAPDAVRRWLEKDDEEGEAAEREAATLREALEDLANAFSRMPDAGLNRGDPRWHWWNQTAASRALARAALAGAGRSTEGEG